MNQKSYELTLEVNGTVGDGDDVSMTLTIEWPAGRTADAARLFFTGLKERKYDELAFEMILHGMRKGEDDLLQSLADFETTERIADLEREEDQ